MFLERSLVSTAAALVLVTSASAVAGPAARAELPAEPAVHSQVSAELDVSVFYGSLSPYGEWFELAPYGWVWAPAGCAPGWRPYTTGHWVWSDDFGWTWVADEPWGWAAFHYGRWTYDDGWGWVWIPGTVWGPAWVTWRHGGGYTGWAPLPPTVGWRVGVGLDFGNTDVHVAVSDSWWSFVAVGDFTRPHIHECVVLPGRNVTFVQQTKIVNNITVVNGAPRNRGIEVADVEKSTGRKVERVRIQDVDRPEEARGKAGSGEIALYRPKVAAKVDPRIRPPAASIRGAPGSKDGDTREIEDLRRNQEREMERLRREHEDERAKADEPTRKTLERRQADEVRAQRANQEREQRNLKTRQKGRGGRPPGKPGKP